MDAPLEVALKKAWTALMAAVWATIGGGVGVLTDAFDDAAVYELPPDWPHLRKLFISGAVLGLVAWVKKERALATPPPRDTISDAAAMKQSAEAAQKQQEAAAIVVIPVDPQAGA